jgi:hypothetical protein
LGGRISNRTVDVRYTMGRTRNYDNVEILRSGRKAGCNRFKRLAQSLTIQRLDQQTVHAGSQAGLAVFGLGIGGERGCGRLSLVSL